MDALMNVLDQWLGPAIDVGLILALFFLWLTWYRNGKRQQHLEQMLADTARQLEEASMHLSVATSAIEELKHKEKHSVQKSRPVEAKAAKEPAVSPAKLPPQNSTQATMILRMKREGETPEAIAERLDIPLAQVRLILKLHTASNSAA